MVKKIIFLFIFSLFINCVSFASSEIFQHQKSAKIIKTQIPKLPAVACKFSQVKSINNSTTLKSGGDFKITKNGEIFFETLYPIKTTTKYSTSENKQITKIINAIKNNKYEYLEKNFILYFNKKDVWMFALKPKNQSPIYKYLNNIILTGNNKNIEQIQIYPKNFGYTKIKFEDCVKL